MRYYRSYTLFQNGRNFSILFASGLEKKIPSGHPGQVDFPFGQVTFSPSLPDRQGPKQAIC